MNFNSEISIVDSLSVRSLYSFRVVLKVELLKPALEGVTSIAVHYWTFTPGSLNKSAKVRFICRLISVEDVIKSNHIKNAKNLSKEPNTPRC